MNYLPLLKASPILLVGSLFSFSFLADVGASSSTPVLPKKFDSLEVVVYVKGSTSSSSPSTNPINLKIAIPHDIYSGSIKAQHKKDDGSYERVDYIKNNAQKEKYKNLAQLAHQFLKVQHRLNLIKSARWKNERDGFDETCKKCCNQTQQPSSCSLCICCKKDCTTPNSADCCCKDPNSNCKWELKKETMDTFFLRLKNLDTANTGKYLSPVKAYITVNAADDSKVEEGSFWGSLVYGFTTYKLKKEETVPSGDEKLLKGILGSSDTPTLSTDKYYANVPQKFLFKFKKEEKTDEKKIGKILEKLSKKDEIVKLMNDTKNAPENLCACCDDSEDMIECLIKRNYWVSVAQENEIKTNIEDKIKDLKEKCCEST